jgi:RNA polymerase sigma factor (sigma-70 family)
VSTPEHELPPLKEGYEDEFGPIDPEVYQAARKIWPTAVRFGEFALHDRQLVLNLMMESVANVSRSIAKGTNIEHLNGYLLRTFKHRVVRDREKRLPRSEPLSEIPDAVASVVADLDRKILTREIFARLDHREREIFQLRMMDYSFEEIGRILDLNNTAVRTRWYRLMRRLRETLAASDNP